MTVLHDIQDESRKIVEQTVYGIRLLEQKHKETLQVLEKALKQKADLKKKIEGLEEQIETWKKKYKNKIYHNE